MTAIPAPTEKDLERGFEGRVISRDDVLILPGNNEMGLPRRIIAAETGELMYELDSLRDEIVEGDPLEGYDEPVQELKGNYIFGGYVRVHFGHFLVECMPPLWTLDHVEEKIDGILLLPYHALPNVSDRNKEILFKLTRKWLTAMGIEEEIQILRSPTRVDRLHVGEPGFGFREKFRGSSYFHRFMRNRCKAAKKLPLKKDRQKIFISRLELGARKGQLIGEKQLERTLVEAGYVSYAPEKFPLEDQLETYRKAEKIVGVEGSALHVPPFSCAPKCQVAIISRRSPVELITDQFGAQFEGFAGVEPQIINESQSYWGLPGFRNTTTESLAIADFEAIYQRLIEGGFLKKTDKFYYPTPQDLTEHLMFASKGHKTHLNIINFDPTRP